VNAVTVAEFFNDLFPGSEAEKKHQHTDGGKTRQRVDDFPGIAGINNVAEERGKNLRRSDGRLQRAQTLSLLFLLHVSQYVALFLGHLADELPQQLSFFYPFGNLLSIGDGNVERVGTFALFPGEQSGLVNRTFLCAAAFGISASFFRDGERTLEEWLDTLNLPQDLTSFFTCVSFSLHNGKVYLLSLDDASEIYISAKKKF